MLMSYVDLVDLRSIMPTLRGGGTVACRPRPAIGVGWLADKREQDRSRPHGGGRVLVAHGALRCVPRQSSARSGCRHGAGFALFTEVLLESLLAKAGRPLRMGDWR
jgi:hypothetical protein